LNHDVQAGSPGSFACLRLEPRESSCCTRAWIDTLRKAVPIRYAQTRPPNSMKSRIAAVSKAVTLISPGTDGRIRGHFYPFSYRAKQYRKEPEKLFRSVHASWTRLDNPSSTWCFDQTRYGTHTTISSCQPAHRDFSLNERFGP